MAIDYTGKKHLEVTPDYPIFYLLRASEIVERGYPYRKSLKEVLQWARELPSNEFAVFEHPEYKGFYLYDKRFFEMIFIHQNKSNYITASEQDVNRRVVWSGKVGCCYERMGLSTSLWDRKRWIRRLYARTKAQQWERVEEAKWKLNNLDPGYILFSGPNKWADKTSSIQGGWINYVDPITQELSYSANEMMDIVKQKSIRLKARRLLEKEEEDE